MDDEPIYCSRHCKGKCVAPSNPQPPSNFNRCASDRRGRKSNCKECSKYYRMHRREPEQEVIGMRWLTIEAHRKLEARQTP